MLSLEGVLVGDHLILYIHDEEIQEKVLQYFMTLIDDLYNMRENEGEKLKSVFLDQIIEIGRLTDQAPNDPERKPEKI